MHTVNAFSSEKVNVGSRSTPFQYAVTLAPVSETVIVTNPILNVEKAKPATSEACGNDVTCRLT